MNRVMSVYTNLWSMRSYTYPHKKGVGHMEKKK